MIHSVAEFLNQLQTHIDYATAYGVLSTLAGGALWGIFTVTKRLKSGPTNRRVLEAAGLVCFSTLVSAVGTILYLVLKS